MLFYITFSLFTIIYYFERSETMANKTESIMAVCPFWEGDSLKAITCEGAIGVRCESSFDSVSDRVKFEAAHCCRNWRQCPLAVVLLVKHGEL